MSMNIKLIAAGALALASFGASAQATLYGGGATLPAQAYVGAGFFNSADPNNSARLSLAGRTNASFEGTLFGEVAQRGFGASQVQGVSYCQTGSGTGRSTLIGTNAAGTVFNASGTCPTFAATPTGFGAPAAIQKPDFAASDTPISAAEYARAVSNARNGGAAPVQFPALAAAIAIIYTNADIPQSAARLNLSVAQVCSIFNGTTNNWNQLNPVYPSKPIRIAYRSDGSGTTFSFANFLAANCPGSGYRAVETFTGASPVIAPLPAGAIGASGNPGVANAVAANDGAIGYAELGDSLLRAPTVRFFNVRGSDPSTLTAPAVTLVYDMGLNGVDANGRPALQAITPNGRAGCVALANPSSYAVQASGYPIVGITYLLAYNGGNRLRDAVRRLIKAPYTGAIENNTDTVGAGTGYAFLSNAVVRTPNQRVNGCVQ